MSWAEVESIIKSCVLSKKGDMTLSDLRGEYFELVGHDIPFETLGSKSLKDFLSKVSGVVLSQNARGETVITATSGKAAHIANLVRKQKTDPKALIKRGKVTSCDPRKCNRTARRISPRTISLNRYTSGTKTRPGNARLSRANGFSDFVAGMDRTSSRLSSTQIRYAPAGEEFSDDSYGCSPVRKEIEASSTVNDLAEQLDENTLDCNSVCKLKQEPNMSPRSKRKTLGFGQDISSYSASLSSKGTLGYYRTVAFTGGTLRCTVTKTLPPEAESTPVYVNEVEDSDIFSSWYNGPTMLGYHLAGDDFLLHFAYECLHTDYEWDDAERLTCGMCISGQTIHDFHMQVQHERIFQPKMVLMLGAVDILQNRSLRCIIEDMADLVEDIIISGVESLILLTLPFLKTAGLSNRKVLVFNEFLKTLDDGLQVKVLDVHPLFNSYCPNPTYDDCMNLKCYEASTREIVCYPNGVVLWSHIGRSYLYNFLLRHLTDIVTNKY